MLYNHIAFQTIHITGISANTIPFKVEVAARFTGIPQTNIAMRRATISPTNAACHAGRLPRGPPDHAKQYEDNNNGNETNEKGKKEIVCDGLKYLMKHLYYLHIYKMHARQKQMPGYRAMCKKCSPLSKNSVVLYRDLIK
jgi:hypothetical protein